jgi:hypothetical protein
MNEANDPAMLWLVVFFFVFVVGIFTISIIEKPKDDDKDE